MPQLPQTLDDAVAQAREATQAAIADGRSRLIVELAFPELKLMPVAQQFLPAFEALGDRFRVFFPDPGAAALARREWGEKPYTIRGVEDLKADIQPHEEVFLFIEPSSVEVERIEALCNDVGPRPAIFLNPRMEDLAIGIGYAGRQLRLRFLNQFETCYYIKPIDNIAIFRCYPSPWQVWVEQDGAYQLVGETTEKPVGEVLDQLLGKALSQGDASSPQSPPRKGLFSNLQQLLRILSQ